MVNASSAYASLLLTGFTDFIVKNSLVRRLIGKPELGPLILLTLISEGGRREAGYAGAMAEPG
jgi:hypothetical protein